MAYEFHISIVVTAYNRREYYRAAVDSAVELARGRDGIEIILLKNFTEDEVDRQLELRGVKIRAYSSPIVGATLRRAIELCQGEYLVFLDDDDLLKPTKLARFDEILHRFPNLGYYHNEYEVLLEARIGLGAWERLSMPRKNRRRRVPRVVAFESPSDPAMPSFLAKKNREQNLSSTIVRADVAKRILPGVEALPAMTDTIMLTAGLISSQALVFDESVQTVVRRHADNSSNQQWNVSQRLRVLQALEEHCTRAQAPQRLRIYLALRAAREVVYAGLMGGEHSRADTVNAVRDLETYYRDFRASRDLAFLLLGGLECSVPSLVARLRPLAAGTSRTPAS
jgi:glycosyltransferase involved in cell wall biosynthesis